MTFGMTRSRVITTAAVALQRVSQKWVPVLG